MLPRHRALTLAVECLICAALVFVSPRLALIAAGAMLVQLLILTKGRWRH